MIKGPLNTYDHRFGDKVNNLIKLVSFINIEYKTVKVKSAESLKKTLFFEFNGFKNAKRFSEGLTKSYDQAIDEIEETLLIDFKRHERLSYISNLSLKFTDVKILLSNDSKIGYKHKNLIFANVTRAKKNKEELNDESYFQEYYALIDQYLNKIIQYLKGQKDSHGMLADSEIPIHQKNTPARDKSTKDNPLKFFQYITTKKGVSNLLQKFKPSKDDFSQYDIVYDDITKVITYNPFDVEHGKHFTTTQSFNDFLAKRLKVEFQISKQLIEEQFKTLKGGSQASFFLKRTLNDLKILVKNAESDKQALGYADIKKTINVLLNHFNTNYAVFITPEKTKINKTIQLDTLDENFAWAVEGLCGKPERFTSKSSIFKYEYELFSWETTLTKDLNELLREHRDIYSFYVDLFTKPTKEMVERYENFFIEWKNIGFLNSQFNFGQFKGKTGKEVLRIEPSYIKWCIKNVEWFEISKYDLYYINKELSYFKLSPKEYKLLTIKALLSGERTINLNLAQEKRFEDNSDYPNLNSNEYYNDSLDYDQQSPEFWDNI